MSEMLDVTYDNGFTPPDANPFLFQVPEAGVLRKKGACAQSGAVKDKRLMTPPPVLPRIAGVLTMFYYDDIRPALRWYRDLIGFETVCDFGWTAVLRIKGDSYLALIDGTNGSQRPTDGRDKGAIISIETDAVDDWLDRLSAAGAQGAEKGLNVGCAGRTREFKVYDPAGYTLEFFEWLDPADAFLPSLGA